MTASTDLVVRSAPHAVRAPSVVSSPSRGLSYSPFVRYEDRSAGGSVESIPREARISTSEARLGRMELEIVSGKTLGSALSSAGFDWAAISSVASSISPWLNQRSIPVGQKVIVERGADGRVAIGFPRGNGSVMAFSSDGVSFSGERLDVSDPSLRLASFVGGRSSSSVVSSVPPASPQPAFSSIPSPPSSSPPSVPSGSSSSQFVRFREPSSESSRSVGFSEASGPSSVPSGSSDRSVSPSEERSILGIVQDLITERVAATRAASLSQERRSQELYVPAAGGWASWRSVLATLDAEREASRVAAIAPVRAKIASAPEVQERSRVLVPSGSSVSDRSAPEKVRVVRSEKDAKPSAAERRKARSEVSVAASPPPAPIFVSRRSSLRQEAEVPSSARPSELGSASSGKGGRFVRYRDDGSEQVSSVAAVSRPEPVAERPADGKVDPIVNAASDPKADGKADRKVDAKQDRPVEAKSSPKPRTMAPIGSSVGSGIPLPVLYRSETAVPIFIEFILVKDAETAWLELTRLRLFLSPEAAKDLRLFAEPVGDGMFRVAASGMVDAQRLETACAAFQAAGESCQVMVRK
jgi:hypothetical protein